MANEKFTRLTLEQNDLKVTWQIPYDDVTGDDMMKAIRTIMIGMSFSEKTIAASMAAFIEEYYEYIVIDHSNDPDDPDKLYPDKL